MSNSTNNAAHTPGPWYIESKMSSYEIHNNKINICSVLEIDIEPEEAQANAHLIAAAPDLLEAAEALLKDAEDREETTDEDGKMHPDWKKLFDAIQKAKGK